MSQPIPHAFNNMLGFVFGWLPGLSVIFGIVILLYLIVKHRIGKIYAISGIVLSIIAFIVSLGIAISGIS